MKGEKLLRTIYGMLLDTSIPGMAQKLQDIGAFDLAFDLWVQLDPDPSVSVAVLNEELEEAVDPVEQQMIIVRVYKHFFLSPPEVAG